MNTATSTTALDGAPDAATPRRTAARRSLVGGITAGLLAAAIGLLGAVAPSHATPGDERGAFEPLSPARIFDTRTGTGAPQARLTAGQRIDVQVTGVGGIPVDATAVVLNVTIDSPTSDTYVRVWPAGESEPQSSTINANTGDRIANMVSLKVGAAGRVSVFNFAGNVDVIFDVAGYYVDADFYTRAEVDAYVDAARPLFAQVSSTGALAGGHRVVSARQDAVGLWSVTFERDVSGCALVANAASVGPDVATIPVTMITARSSTAPNVVWVDAFDLVGTPTSTPFHLTVTCP